jgi:hypothetical protein
MSRRTFAVFVGLCGLAGLITFPGCARELPPVVPVKGKVMLNGQPLPKASVTFVPQLEKFGSESNSTAVTDENGEFTLTCAYNSQPGAVVAKHIVLVAESPLPDELRGSRDARAIDRYQATLGNRPIPTDYGTVSTSSIRVEIKKGQEPVTIELKRN